MTDWKIVDEHGADVMTAESVREFANTWRTTPRLMARREARLLNSGGHGDAPVTAVKA